MTSDSESAGLRSANADLRQRLNEALAQQSATAEILQVISRSTFDLQLVLSLLANTAARLCSADQAAIFRRDGELYNLAANFGFPPEYEAMFDARGPFPADAGSPTVVARAAVERHGIHINDVAAIPGYPKGAVILGRQRTSLGVPLLREGEPVGVILLARQRVEPFTDPQIELVSTFADQAVIAIENTRLLTEQREALEQQTATAEVLQVINSSPGDLAPVFDAMLEKGIRLSEAAFGVLCTFDGEYFRAAAMRGIPAPYAEYLSRQPLTFAPGSGPARVLAGQRFHTVADFATDQLTLSGDPTRRALVDLGGARTGLAVPLRKDAALVGMFLVFRPEVRPFTEKQIALLENFAAQAVIAMENARLITETREALEQQTATAEVLQVINNSPGELAPVFDAMLDKALVLCDAAFGVLWTYDGKLAHAVALRGVSPAYAEFLTRTPHPVGPENALGRLLGGESVVHIADAVADQAYRSGDPTRRALVELGGGRTLLAVSLRKDNTFLGHFVIYRREVRPFSDKQTALLQNFAAQAVIAMENARLLTETREALEQQTATAEVLQVINASPGNLAPVFDAMLEKAMRLCGGTMGGIFTFDGDHSVTTAVRGVSAAFEQYNDKYPMDEIQPGTVPARIIETRGPVQNLDVTAGEAYRAGHPYARALVELGGIRAVVAVPLLKDGLAAGMVAIYRQEAGAFSDKQIALLQNFAAQAVIAVENARLLDGIRAARDTAESAYRDLKAAQASLIQAEKMASLGQLTAGIAHEIKNPLNFVNNFAGLSVELLDELKEAAEPAMAALADDRRAAIDETIAMLTGNLEKIAEHGKRADGIVKSMLEHSRGVSSERRAVDLNNLVEEALNLAYHGARAQDQAFDITLERDYDHSLGQIQVVPQEMNRVFINLIGNGFYAASKRQRAGAEADFRPTLTVATRDLGDAVEIRVRDNGVGIAPEIRDKLFQPFFTTKPTGEGTGLGLSISYDIVTQQHGGTIEVDSRVGEFTEFAIRLPRTRSRTTAESAEAETR